MMNNQLPIHTNESNSQVQKPQPPTATNHLISINIESQLESSMQINIESQLESSIQILIKSWYARQKWHSLFFFFNPKSQQQNRLITGNNRSPWRTQLANFLESTPIHGAAVFLLLLDLIFTTLELSSSLLSCYPNGTKKTEQAWFHWVGISILIILLAKIVALAVGLGIAEFLKRPGYVVDGGVMMGALILEAFLEKKVGGFLVVVSLWRVVRVIESAFELSDEAIEAQIEGIVCQFEALNEENKRLLATIAEKDVVISQLWEDLDRCRQACNRHSCTAS
ncbi:hypothetical protein FNV43_RR01751 [Rhamnella rubrinervis]|uniref:Voltage-gated hydrogen channel 1 n=1 Tax=Rhamnella rubrinervis TaxID=2594499 RepID=A0A8K0HSZ2_9ROSA|nr:hypothetical protein FNV43_RR01751 [Rhamnella rubrinervis]